MNRAVLGVIVMTLCVGLYIAVSFQRAVVLLASGQPMATVIGAALLVIPLIAVWAIWRELQFGLRSDRLFRALLDEEYEQFGEPAPAQERTELNVNRIPSDTLPTNVRGRVDRERADGAFADYQAQAQRVPQQWQAQFRLGLIYDACGDRRRARRALRNAIALARA